MGTATEENQKTMFDLDSRELNPDYIDPTQKLIVYKKPLEYKAHKLQLLLLRLDKQAEKNPAQFNSRAYIEVLTEYENCMAKLNRGESDEVDDTSGMGEKGNAGTAPGMGETASSSVDPGVSPDNPFSGQGSDTT